MSPIFLISTVVGSILFLASVESAKFNPDSGCPRLGGRAYELKGYKSSYCVTPRGFSTQNDVDLHIWDCGKHNAQKWMVKNLHWRDEDNLDTNELFGWYAIVNSESGKCLTLNREGGHAADNNRIYEYDCAPENGRENKFQMWAFTESSWGTSYGYTIMNFQQPRCLAVYAGSTAAGAVLALDDCHSDWYNQLFMFSGC